MKHIVKTVSRFLLLSLTLGCGFFALGQNNHSWTANYAEGDSSSTQSKTYTAADFTGEEEIPSDELEITLIQNNTTETSQSLNFTFKSKTLVCFSTMNYDFVVNIYDPAFTGTTSEPVDKDFKRYDEESHLPILEGEVLYVLNQYRNSGEAYIPGTFTLDETFIIDITTINTHCVTAAGSQYKVGGLKNSWYEDDGVTLKYTQLHIPSSVTKVRSNAFVDVPAGVTITYEGTEIPEGFAADWTDASAANIVLGQYGSKSSWRKMKVSSTLDNVTDDRGRPMNFCLGCEEDGKKNIGEEYNCPLVIQYDVVSKNDGSFIKTVYEELPLTNTNGIPYDSVGPVVSNPSYSRLLGFKLGANETIDDTSIIFHNIMKFNVETATAPDSGSRISIDTSKRLCSRPIPKYKEKLDISKLVSFKAASHSTFAGFSMFSFTMDKNLSITSEQYPEEHSLYLDVKSDFYETNKARIESGLTEIRYSLYNLYLSEYHFVYEGKGGQLKDITLPVTTPISYQTLEKTSNNKVSIIISHNDLIEHGKEVGADYSDFSADKVRTFEIVNLTIQMDLLATSDSGSKSVLAKSQVGYKFAYVTVINDEKISVFNWNIFLIIFLVGYIALFAAGAFALYKYKKEKYKNDEFRRVNDKKYLKSAVLYGLGFMVIAYAIIFIFMRAVGFANTIVAFNPTDPLLIAFAIAGMIIGGYFIVLAIKSIKTENERKKAIRLRLNEDVEDDGTN